MELKRIAELKCLFMKIYEDYANGRLSDERFNMLSQNYEVEQKQLKVKDISLQQEIEALDAYTLHELGFLWLVIPPRGAKIPAFPDRRRFVWRRAER